MPELFNSTDILSPSVYCAAAVYLTLILISGFVLNTIVILVFWRCRSVSVGV